MSDNIFDPKHLEKLNDPERLEEIPPDYIWEKLEIENPDVIVDIGAGTGFFSQEFHKFTNNGKVYAFDISDIMVTWMENNVAANNSAIIPNIIRHDTLPLKSESVDLVYMINLHHELENHENLLCESHRVLKKGRKLFIVDWKKDASKHGPPNHIRLDAKTVARQLEPVGFSNIKIYNDLEKHFLLIAEKS